MRKTLRSMFLGLAFVILASVPWIGALVGGDLLPYGIATVLLASLVVGMVLAWDRLRPEASADDGTRRLPGVLLVVAIAAVVLASVAGFWIIEVTCHPHDAKRADQLVVVQQGIQRLFAGRNPYEVYRLPWEATLAYGPVLWGPFVVPYLLRLDLRFVSIVGALFVPVACAIAAVVLARRRRWAEATGWLAVCAIVGFDPSLRHFVSFAHTASYWPLIGLFAWLVADGRWRAAAVAMGLLVVARTTMVAVVPVFWMTAWRRDRARFSSVVALTIAAAAVPFLPFLVWDPAALAYSFFGGYQSNIKGWLWRRATVVQHSVGVTGWLLATGWPRAVEPVQLLAMLGTWAAAWRAIARGAAPLPWMALALFVFSMTSLWPVYYLYFDVFVLFACAALAETAWLAERRRAGAAWGLVTCTAVLLTVGAVWGTIPRRARIDVGSERARPYLRGFGDVGSAGARSFAVLGPAGSTVVLPRRSLRDATIVIVWRGFDGGATSRDVEIVLNDVPIARTRPGDRWTQTALTAPGALWRIGVNELRFAVAPAAVAGAAPASPSIAIDRVTIRRATHAADPSSAVEP